MLCCVRRVHVVVLMSFLSTSYYYYYCNRGVSFPGCVLEPDLLDGSSSRGAPQPSLRHGCSPARRQAKSRSCSRSFRDSVSQLFSEVNSGYFRFQLALTVVVIEHAYKMFLHLVLVVIVVPSILLLPYVSALHLLYY